MPINHNGFGGNLVGRANAAADTVFYAVVPGRPQAFVRVPNLNYTAGNTANSIYAMRPLGRANVTVAATTSDQALTLDADPSPTGNTIAAGDSVVIQHSDGTYRRAQVNTSGWNGTTKVVTFTGTLAAAVAIGAKVWNMGIFTDTDPVFGTAHPLLPTAANTTASITFQGGGIKGHNPGDPILFYCPNATNATAINFIEFSNGAE